jgi:hypothetical protein
MKNILTFKDLAIAFSNNQKVTYYDDEDVRDYAEWHLDIQSEWMIDDPQIEDFETDEIFDELLHRYNIQKDIVSVNKIKEFLNNYYL